MDDNLVKGMRVVLIDISEPLDQVTCYFKPTVIDDLIKTAGASYNTYPDEMKTTRLPAEVIQRPFEMMQSPEGYLGRFCLEIVDLLCAEIGCIPENTNGKIMATERHLNFLKVTIYAPPH